MSLLKGTTSESDKTFEQYMEYLGTKKKKYQWPLDGLKNIQKKRREIWKEFPYVITVAASYYWLDDVNDICRANFGDRYGECYWRDCEFSFDTWFENNKFIDKLDKIEKLDQGQGLSKASKSLSDEYWKMIENRIDKPGEHWHKGVWTTNYLTKTGYDYGYEDFCFKHEVDWLKFIFLNVSFDSIEAHIEGERK